MGTMSRRASRSPKGSASFLARLGVRAVGAIVVTIVILFLSLMLGLGAVMSTSIFHSFGNGFALADNQVQTSVIVRNDSPFSVPGVEFPYSYGAQIIEGSAGCELLLKATESDASRSGIACGNSGIVLVPVAFYWYMGRPHVKAYFTMSKRRSADSRHQP